MENSFEYGGVYNISWNNDTGIRKGVYLGTQDKGRKKPYVLAMKKVKYPDEIVVYHFSSFSFEKERVIIHDAYAQHLSDLEEKYLDQVLAGKDL